MTRDHLISRLNALAEERMAQKARHGRSRALMSISHCCLVVTDDGATTREVVFDHPPTIGQIFERVGPDVWAVSIQMRQAARKQQE